MCFRVFRHFDCPLTTDEVRQRIQRICQASPKWFFLAARLQPGKRMFLTHDFYGNTFFHGPGIERKSRVYLRIEEHASGSRIELQLWAIEWIIPLITVLIWLTFIVLIVLNNPTIPMTTLLPIILIGGMFVAFSSMGFWLGKSFIRRADNILREQLSATGADRPYIADVSN